MLQMEPESPEVKLLEVSSTRHAKLEWSLDKSALDGLQGKQELRSSQFSVSICGQESLWSVSIHPRGVLKQGFNREEVSSYPDEVHVGLHRVFGDSPCEALDFETSHTVAFRREQGFWPEENSLGRQPRHMTAQEWRHQKSSFLKICLRDDLQKVYMDHVSVSQHKDTYIVKQRLVLVIDLKIEVPEDLKQRYDQFSESMKNMQDMKEFSDVTLVCGDRSFPCHKVILASRSNVLRAMLDNEMKEKQDNRIEIVDSSPEVVEMMISHIYSGSVPKDQQLHENGPEILHLAVQYNLVSLISMCEESMLRDLTSENCLKTFIYIDRYSSTVKLREQVLKFLSKKAKEIVGKGDWDEFIASYPKLATEIFLAVIENNSPPTQASQLSKKAKLHLL